jgi:hypothetical protein
MLPRFLPVPMTLAAASRACFPPLALAFNPCSLRLSAIVTPKFFPLYHFFPLLSPLFFHLPQRFPLNTPPISHYHYKISFSISTINFLSTNNYSWTHTTVFGDEQRHAISGGREGGRRLGGAVGGIAAAIECPLRAACKGRGLPRGQRCA